MRVLVTGGAGFVGSSLALALKATHPAWTFLAFDNLRRRGVELTLPRLKAGGVEFLHGDVRSPQDFEEAGAVDLVLDCAAEPSVQAGLNSSASYCLETNLVGTIHALEHARRHRAGLVFLSSSRVYPMEPIERLPLRAGPRRFEWLEKEAAQLPGASAHGISEDFPLAGVRSLYGATKLASELLIQEYVAAYGLRAWINRCGVLAGPWQMGKVDQGIVTHWVLSHALGRPLRYLGYGGTGQQVRDVLHVADLARLVDAQLSRMEQAQGQVFNVGGGAEGSVSLVELTELCRRATGRQVEVGSDPAQRPNDVRWFVTDARRAQAYFSWKPHVSPEQLVEDVAAWVNRHRAQIEGALG